MEPKRIYMVDRRGIEVDPKEKKVDHPFSGFEPPPGFQFPPGFLDGIDEDGDEAP